jgi:tRNA threonylcarbamoyladenosine biosynthesis protein TsaB
MKILALEFSSGHRSVAVSHGEILLAQKTTTGGRSVAAFSMIESALAEAKIEREEIETIAIGLGPGSYTGIRAAIALAQGWQLARRINTIGVSSVVALALHAQMQKIFGRVNVVINAQREEFYFATYEITEAARTELAPLKILSNSEVQSRLKEGGVIIGPEAGRFEGRIIFPPADAVAQLAAGRNDFLPGEKLEPIYLRETTFVKAANISKSIIQP